MLLMELEGTDFFLDTAEQFLQNIDPRNFSIQTPVMLHRVDEMLELIPRSVEIMKQRG